MSRDVDDLLGRDTETEEPWSPGDWAQVGQNGVGVDWLSGAFRMDRRKVRAKLATCKPIGERKTPTGVRPVYDLREAASYLSPNRDNIADALRSMKSSDLPSQLQKDVWDARLKELKWRELAGELWRTEDVLAVFGEVFMSMKGQMQLWVDQLAETTTLDDDQRRRLTEMVDALQADIHLRLVEQPKQKATRSVADLEAEGDGGL